MTDKRTGDRLYDWVVDHNRNVPLVVALSLLCPQRIVRSIYAHNSARKPFWKGKRSCFTLSFDCDYPRDAEAMPYVLDLLKKHDIRTSYAAVGHWVEMYPDIHRRIVAEGHEIVNHTYSHPDNEILNPGRKFRDIPRQEKLEEVAKCHDVVERVLGVSPAGCRIPHFGNLFSHEIYGILKELDYKYSSSTYLTNTRSFGDPFIGPEGIVEIPLATCLKHPFTVFDTWHSLNSSRLFYKLSHHTKRAYQEIFKRLVDIGIETGSYINVYVDPYDILVMPLFGDLLQYVQDRSDDILIARYDELLDLPLRESETVHAG